MQGNISPVAGAIRQLPPASPASRCDPRTMKCPMRCSDDYCPYERMSIVTMVSPARITFPSRASLALGIVAGLVVYTMVYLISTGSPSKSASSA